jgi:voltage-gated potassium channel
VGYGDVFNTFDSLTLTVFNTVAILTYMGAVAYAVSNFTAFLIEGRLKRYFQYKKNLKRIQKMDNHYIICGIHDIGIFVAQELHETRRSFVVIDEDLNAIDNLKKQIPGLVSIQGDATDDSVLIEAGIKKAKAVITALDNDKENLYLVVAAKDLNKHLQVATKFINPKTRQKFINAGANYLVSPNMIGGLRIASELIRPQVVSFLDRMLRTKKAEAIRVEEIKIAEDSSFRNKTLYDFYRETGVLIISYYDPERQDFEYNPDPSKTIVTGMILIFISTPEQRIQLEKTFQVG